MAEIIRMPKLSDTMTEGVVAQWHKKKGDKVKSGELLADIETDKATMEFESFQEGTLLYIGVEKGKAAPVDSILAIVGNPGEDIAPLLEAEKKKTPAAQTDSPEAPAKPAGPLAKPSPVQKEPTQKTAEKPPVAVGYAPVSEAGGRLKASPLAKRLAKERSINIRQLRGTGDGGRIVKRDIESYIPGIAAHATNVEGYADEPVSQMRKTIAKRLVESKFSAPHFYLTIDIDMDEMVKAREAINEVSPVKISFNDLIVKAAAHSLRGHSKVNASWRGETIRYYQHIHVGVAIAVEEGLLVPVIRFADAKTLSQIAAETKAYSQKAREKKLQPSDWEGNTFTVSNLGMFGIEEFTAIINPPDSCILAVGGIRDVPVVKGGEIVPGYMMKVTLSCDHRVVDGVTGAMFLQTFRQCMENPVVFLGTQNI